MFVERFVSKYILPRIGSKNVLIGIDGGQGAGKTYFIAEIQKAFKALSVVQERAIIVLETDDFLIERSKREHLSADFFNDISNLGALFDFSKAAEILRLSASLHTTQYLLTRLYNTETGKCDCSRLLSFKEQNIVLVGGPYLLESSYPVFDLRVFLDVDEERRLYNTLERNEGRSRSAASQRSLFQNFEKFYKPYFDARMCEYDVIIDNTDFHARKIVQTL